MQRSYSHVGKYPTQVQCSLVYKGRKVDCMAALMRRHIFQTMLILSLVA